jgi:hypothetical protein
VSFSNYPATNPAVGRKLIGGLCSLGERQHRRNLGILMIGKFADPHEDLMPWEMTDSGHHRNDRHRPANEREEETHRFFQSHAGSTKVEVEDVEGVEGIP